MCTDACLTALFGIQRQPSSLASSLSMGPQHLFPLLCGNFLYLARSWALVWCAGQCFYQFKSDKLFSFLLLLLLSCSKDSIRKKIQLGRTTKHFSPGHVNVRLSLAGYCHVALLGSSANCLPSQAEEK